MKMFEGLMPNQALKVGSVFVVCLPYGSFSINGVKVYSTQTQFVVDSLSSIFKVVSKTKEITHYVSKEGKVISIQEHSEASNALNKFYDEDEHEWSFESLEQEFDLRSKYEHITKATPVYEDKPETLIPYGDNIVVVGHQVDTGSNFISTCYSFGRVESGVFKLDLEGIVTDELKKICLDNDFKLDTNPTGSIKFAKVEGYFVGSNYVESFLNDVKVFKNLSEAKKKESSIRTALRNHLEAKYCKKPVDSITVSKLHNVLLSVRDSIKSLEIKQKSQFSKGTIVNKLNELVSELEQSINKEGK